MPAKFICALLAKLVFGTDRAFRMMQFANRVVAVCKIFAHPFSSGVANTRICWNIGPATDRHAACRENSCRVKASGGNNATKEEIFMSTLAAKGNWNIARGKWKQKLARLTDDDLQLAEGMENELTGRIQKRAAHKNVQRAEPGSCRQSKQRTP
jgi:uncharacterized protein YjbJ (UPF0337 family)